VLIEGLLDDACPLGNFEKRALERDAE